MNGLIHFSNTSSVQCCPAEMRISNRNEIHQLVSILPLLPPFLVERRTQDRSFSIIWDATVSIRKATKIGLKMCSIHCLFQRFGTQVLWCPCCLTNSKHYEKIYTNKAKYFTKDFFINSVLFWEGLYQLTKIHRLQSASPWIHFPCCSHDVWCILDMVRGMATKPIIKSVTAKDNTNKFGLRNNFVLSKNP